MSDLLVAERPDTEAERELPVETESSTDRELAVEWLSGSRARIAIAAAAVVALVIALMAAFGGDDPIKPGEARLTVNGEAVVNRGGIIDRVRGQSDLQPGDEVKVVDGDATIEFAGDLVLEGQAGTDDMADTEIRVGLTPEVLAGETLVVAGGRSQVTAGGTSISIDTGSARITRDLGVVAEAYTAPLTIGTAGVESSVPALRQVSIAAAGLPGRLTPIDVRNPDRWLQRVLGDAIALGEQLQAQSIGYTAQLRAVGAGRTAGFYRDTVPGLSEQPGFTASLIDLNRSPGEIMVGSVIAVLGAGDPFQDRWDQVFSFRSQGAQWGLVALEQGIERRPLLDQIDVVLAASPSVPFAGDNVASGPDPVVTDGPSSTTTTVPPSGTTTTTTAPPPDPGGPEPTNPPDGPLPVDPTIPPVPVIDDVLEGLGLGGL